MNKSLFSLLLIVTLTSLSASSEIDSFRNIGANVTLSYGFDL